MSKPITDPSEVYIRATQYLLNKKLEGLQSKKFTYKAHEDDDVPSGTISWNNVSAKHGLGPPRPGIHVAIIGAGVAGLRTAMLCQQRGIPYKIFEANDGPGGRLYTYRFPSDACSPAGKHDYYEVGGMRFPNNAANKPTFDLFKELGFTFRSDTNPHGELIPFVYGLDDNVRLFNSEC